MNKLIPLLAFSILLLVPVGAQQVFANHPNLSCPPPGILSPFLSLNYISANLNSVTFCYTLIGVACPAGYARDTIFEIITAVSFTACTTLPQSTPDPTHQDQCQDKATLVGNHCVPDLSQVCGSGTTPQNLMCFAQSMGSMIGGALLDINTVSLLVASIGTNPIITGLVGITIAGVAGQAVWFVHRRKKSKNS